MILYRYWLVHIQNYLAAMLKRRNILLTITFECNSCERLSKYVCQKKLFPVNYIDECLTWKSVLHTWDKALHIASSEYSDNGSRLYLSVPLKSTGS